MEKSNAVLDTNGASNRTRLCESAYWSYLILLDQSCLYKAVAAIGK